MSTKPILSPPNLTSLEKRISNIARLRGSPVRRIQRAVANIVVGQMLPRGVVKGGTAMQLRVGEAASRFTPDFDVFRPADLSVDDYISMLADRLAEGWGGFTGTVAPEQAAQPPGEPEAYVMQPFSIRLAYRSRHWLTIRLELGHDEIGSAMGNERRIADDLVALFAEIGLDRPEPIPVMAVDHQVAQKLHACTSMSGRTGTNERAHDLVDLQILVQEEELELATVRATAVRLFASRRGQAWPPAVVARDSWASIYREAADGLGVIPDVGDAVRWTNELIGRIEGG